MTKEEVLQKANDYCTEKTYTSETLTDEFKEKFSDFFAQKYSDASVDDEAMIADLKFNLDTAFNATSKSAESKQKAFEDKENEYKRQIAELNKKIGKKSVKENTYEIPDELQEQIKELKAYKDKQAKEENFDNIMTIAKKGIRQDLRKSFEAFAKGVDVDLNKADNEQASILVSRFQEIFKDSIGSVKPLAPQQTAKRDAEFMSQLKPIKV